MGNRDVDARVATEVMGWDTCCDHECKGCDSSVMVVRKRGSEEIMWAIRHPITRRLGWSPSTDITAAKMVWEKIEEEARVIQFYWTEAGGWMCSITIVEETLGGGEDFRYSSATADTIEEAICLAALRAKGRGVDDD